MDLGCGIGTDAIYLATHGWDVTGVDITPAALALARRNATAAGVAPRLIHGDVTRLADLEVGDGYTLLLLDFGCFHTLPDGQRPAYVTGVSRAAAPGATFLLLGFSRVPKAVPVHAGITVEEVRQRFASAGWELINAQRSVPETKAPRRLRDRFEFRSYQLRRLPS